MATWKETYVKLAIAFDATISDPPEEIVHLAEARSAIIDLTTINDGSEPGYGREATVNLLMYMDLLYRQAKQHYSYDSWRNQMIKKINDFTIRYFGSLSDFVNSLDWPDLCVPSYWAELSANIHYDTSDWIVCS